METGSRTVKRITVLKNTIPALLVLQQDEGAVCTGYNTFLFSALCLFQVLGEYSHLRDNLEPDRVLMLLSKLLDMKQTSTETKSWVLMAITKLCEAGAGVSIAHKVSEAYSSSMDTVLRQRAHELQHLSQDSELRARVLPRDSSLESPEVML